MANKSMLLDLDILKRPLQVKLGGETYSLASCSLISLSRVGEMQEAIKNATEKSGALAEVRDAVLALLKFLVPGAPEQALQEMEDAQLSAILEFWMPEAKEQALQESADAAETVEHPTSPG